MEGDRTDAYTKKSSKNLGPYDHQSKFELSDPEGILDIEATLLDKHSSGDGWVEMATTYRSKYLNEHEDHKSDSLRSQVKGATPVDSN